jgi:hypothetical protein
MAKSTTNRILSRLPFVRISQEDEEPSPFQRPRKGSLRTTLLTTASRKSFAKNREEDPSTETDEDGEPLSIALVRSTQSSAGQPRRLRKSSIPAPIPIIGMPPIRSTQSHDYRETEWWGWIILLATWIVFVVGMGSCLEVWSWAWDVGETPYAPPELEDDPTLPIVGYYPALIVMTGVMAWVWVIVAWVGMKYFRHAKVWDGED